MCRMVEENETNLVDSSKQRHELAEQSGTQTGDVHERTLTEGEETGATLKKKKKKKCSSILFVVH